MLLGYSRGAVGDIVFARSKGQQVARARNRNPNNPNTEAQVLQRSKFAAAQRFFQLANSQFFKFAYEDKTERESDYNAFMRHNVGISPYILREMTRQVDYPAFAPWMVTQGSLPSLQTGSWSYVSDSEGSRWAVSDPFGVQSLLLSSYTVADVTSKLIGSGSDWREGDIITFIVQYSEYGSYPLAATSGTSDVVHYTSSAIVNQLILDRQDVRLLSNVVAGLTGVDYSPKFNNSFATDEHGAVSVAVIHSRNTAQGLKVSTQAMILNNDASGGTLEGALASYNFTRSADYEGRILQSWDAASKAVLQGAKASLFVPSSPIWVQVDDAESHSVGWVEPIPVAGTGYTLQVGFDGSAVNTAAFSGTGLTINDVSLHGAGTSSVYAELDVRMAGTAASLAYMGQTILSWE